MDREEIKKSLEFRTVRENEFEQLANVFNKAFNVKRSPEDMKNKILGDKKHGCERQFVAVHDGTLVGMVRADYKPLYFTASPDNPFKKFECGEINDVATLKEYRKMGIARKLLLNAIDYMIDKGWEIAVLQANPKYHARALYESEGFKDLPSTWDIWHVNFGKFKIIWKMYRFLAIIFPIFKILARMIAPQPPKSLKDIIKNENPKKQATDDDTGLKTRIIRVIGEIDLDHPWIKPWLDGINEQKKCVQGIYESYIDNVSLKKDLNEAFPEKMMKKYEKNKQFLHYIEHGGTKNNFLLIQLCDEKENVAMKRVDSSDTSGDKIIGGLRYTIADLTYGPLKVAVPMLYSIFVREKYKNQGLGTLLLKAFRDDISDYFPFALCKSGSGNIALRKALKKSKFHDIISVITMVRALNNKKLFHKLEDSTEPWLLN